MGRWWRRRRDEIRARAAADPVESGAWAEELRAMRRVTDATPTAAEADKRAEDGIRRALRDHRPRQAGIVGDEVHNMDRAFLAAFEGRPITSPPASATPWADPKADILGDLRKAHELAATMPYRLDEYVCPWCPTLAYGWASLAWHIVADHPRHAAELGLEVPQ